MAPVREAKTAESGRQRARTVRLLLALATVAALLVALAWGLRGGSGTALAAGSDRARGAARARASGTSCPRCDIVLITFDTLRADRIKAYGYDKNTSPHLDAFARESVVFTNVMSQSGTTIPSLASLMTSRFPYTDGIMERANHAILSAGELTLAEILKASGYQTAAIVGHEMAQSRFGFGQGFDLFDEDHRPYEKGTVTSERAIRTLRGLRSPYFVWVHLRPPHAPYEPTDEAFAEFYSPRRDGPTLATGGESVSDDRIAELLAFYTSVDPPEPTSSYRDWGDRPATYTPTILAQLQAAYDGNVRRADDAFGSLLRYVDRAGSAADRTVVVVAADHGESLGEHGIFNHNSLYYGVLRTPLIVRLPGRTHDVRSDPAMNVDILPTLLGVVDVDLPHRVRGHDLLRPGSPTASTQRDQYAEYEHMQTLKRGGLKLIHAEGTGGSGDPRQRQARGRGARGRTSMLFDVAADPDEGSNLFRALPRRAETLRVAIDSLASIGSHGDQRAADSELFEQLRALGYVQ